MDVESSTTATADRAGRGAWLLLFVLSGNMLLDSIEGSVVLLAVPEIGRSLGASSATTQWLLSGFALGFAAFIVLGPAITARWGTRKVYLGAMVVFTVASLLGGLTEDIGLLIATRVLKGGCVALTAPLGLALIGAAFPDATRQRRAVLTYALFGAAGFTVGLVLSGVLTGIDWRWTFLAPAPVALALLLVGSGLITHAPAQPRRGLSGRVRERGLLLRSTFGAAALNGAYIGLLLVISVQLDERRWAPWQIALALLPACVPLVISVPFAGRLIAWFGTVRLIAAGAGAALLAGVLALWRSGGGPYMSAMLPALLLVGIALVLSFAALNTQAAAGTAPDDRPAAVAFFQTGVQLGAAALLVPVGVLLAGTDSYRPALIAVVAAAFLCCATAAAGLWADRSEREVRP
ncbi:MFS transporter [Nocardia asteroides]|uniref:MFS transporter n=1 Tax=Nocardia asteroides TaxID=1824 RepID=UPI001E4E8D67|nr:MFS transporter [Nocardia asteroides]UGT55275.1 MFS transporter [Nocardia asteroides]